MQSDVLNSLGKCRICSLNKPTCFRANLTNAIGKHVTERTLEEITERNISPKGDSQVDPRAKSVLC